MKPYLALTVACLSLHSVSAAEARPPHQRHQPEAQQRAGIKKLLASYERSLNAGDAGGVVRLYTDDGVLLAPQAPSAVGAKAVRDAYTTTFQAIDLDITFDIAEMKVLSPEWAFLRTNSTGVINILANASQVPEGNQELFLLHKLRGRWKIARYSFSSILPSA